MSWFKKLSCFLIVLSALSFSAGDAYAQNVFKLDFMKTSGKFGTWVQKQAENFENAMKEIGESQFATFIGKGIEAAKKGIAFVKEKINQVKEIYKKVKDTIDAVKESTEYKIAKLSVEAAKESAVLAEMTKQRNTEKAAIKADIEMQRVTLEEKLKIAKENYAIGIEVLESEVAELQTEEERDVKRKEVVEFRKANEASIQQIEAEMEQVEENSKEQIKNLEIGYATILATQAAVIAGIGMEIAELVEQKKKEKGQMETDPTKVIDNAIEDFSFKEGEVVTLEVRNKKEKTRRRRRESASTAAGGLSASIASKTEDRKDEESQNSGTSETMNGKSEALQTAISQTAVQLDALYEYMLIELKAIELETANIMSENNDYKASEVDASINICNYEIDKKGFLDRLKDAKDKAQGAVDKAKGAVDKAKGAVDKAKGAIEDVTAAVGTVVATGAAVAGVVESVKSGDVSEAANAVTGLTGM